MAMQELSLNILDIAQNSICADASLIEIYVSENFASDIMKITIKDDGCGMSEEMVSRVIDPFFTTRTTRNVGLGVPFFKMAAEQTGGSFSISSELGKGTFLCAEFVLSSIDLTPLGDMAGTVCALVMPNPNLDFVYTREISGASFIMDTREIREILEGVPLSEPDVINFIKSYIEENTKEISGGKNS